MNKIIHGDCLEEMRKMPEGRVDCVLTDPPYGYSFMGKEWDKAVPSVEIWRECLRILKPGAFAFVMSSPRQDVLSQMIVRLTEAGFDTDFTSIYWTYASGFPKAMNIGKMVDKRMGLHVPVMVPTKAANKPEQAGDVALGATGFTDISKRVSPEAKALDGSYGGFQPKPALENIICAQKPLDLRAELTIMISQVINRVNALCLDAFSAEKISTLPKTLREDIARSVALDWHIEAAITEVGRVGGTNVPMDILKFTLAQLGKSQSTSWNIGLLWNAILVELLARMSMFTTETASRTITDLRTLNYLLSQTTQGITTEDGMLKSGGRLNVGAVEAVLRSVLTSFSPEGTSALSDASSVILPPVEERGSAFSAERASHGEAKASSESSAPSPATTRPEVRVIIVAMKPLSEKTYVDQALKNGKGVTWLDDARIPTGGEATEHGMVCSCQEQPTQSNAESAEGSASADRPPSKSSVPASADTLELGKTLGTPPDDTSKKDTSCSEETSAESTSTSSSTSGSGSENTAPNQSAPSFTTATETSKTTASQTSNSCPVHNTEATTTRKGGKSGRFPANIIVSDDILGSEPYGHSAGSAKKGKVEGIKRGVAYQMANYSARVGDSGSYSRFFSLDAWADALPEHVRKVFPFLIVPKAPAKEKFVYLTCDCEAPKMDAWVNADQSQNEPTGATSLVQDTSEETSEDDFGSNTASSGNKPTDASPRATASTTRTTTNSTIDSPISNSSMPSPTNDSTEGANSEKVSGGSLVQPVGNTSPSPSSIGTSPSKAGSATGFAAPAGFGASYAKSVCENCGASVRREGHATVKPVTLMSYLITLGSRPGDTVLDPFLGSGTTACAAKLLDRNYIGIEREAEYVAIARARVEAVRKESNT